MVKNVKIRYSYTRGSVHEFMHRWIRADQGRPVRRRQREVGQKAPHRLGWRAIGGKASCAEVLQEVGQQAPPPIGLVRARAGWVGGAMANWGGAMGWLETRTTWGIGCWGLAVAPDLDGASSLTAVGVITTSCSGGWLFIYKDYFKSPWSILIDVQKDNIYQ